MRTTYGGIKIPRHRIVCAMFLVHKTKSDTAVNSICRSGERKTKIVEIQIWAYGATQLMPLGTQQAKITGDSINEDIDSKDGDFCQIYECFLDNIKVYQQFIETLMRDVIDPLFSGALN